MFPKSITQNIAKHEACSFAYHKKCSFDDKKFKFVTFRGGKVVIVVIVEKFLLIN